MRKLYIRQKVFKITDHYPIMDEYQNPIYQVDQDFNLIGDTVHVKEANGPEIFVVEKVIFSLLPQFVVTFRDGSQIKIKSRLALLRRHIDVESDTYNLRLEGSFWDYSFRVFHGETVIGEISQAVLSWADTYELTIYDEAFEQIVIALMIAVDHLRDRK
ncbi:MAG: LURP-one-related family protein [Bacillota bacterium]|nr:LURP-one-related family protein [Bacillota bacterium]